MTLADQLDRYVELRGIPTPTTDTAVKVLEEAAELDEAIQEGFDWHHIYAELADVVLAATILARTFGVTIEECIQYKTELDTGRGPKVKA